MVSVCLPSDALLQYLLSPWISLTFDVGYLFTSAPQSAAAAPYLGRVAPPDLERGVAPLGPPVPAQLGGGVPPLSCCP